MELPTLAEDIHVEAPEASQNTNHNLQGFLGIDKALHSIQSEHACNTSKLAHINKYIKQNSEKLKEVEDDFTFFKKQQQLYRDDLKTEQQGRLEIQ